MYGYAKPTCMATRSRHRVTCDIQGLLSFLPPQSGKSQMGTFSDLSSFQSDDAPTGEPRAYSANRIRSDHERENAYCLANGNDCKVATQLALLPRSCGRLRLDHLEYCFLKKNFEFEYLFYFILQSFEIFIGRCEMGAFQRLSS